MARQEPFTSEETALSWAGSHLNFDNQALVSKAPWSKIYKLNGGSRTAYLKLVPTGLTSTLRTTSALAQYFSELVPAVIARDDGLGLMLFIDHGGSELGRSPTDEQRRKLIATYAQMQATARHLPELLSRFQTLDISGLLPRLLDFLKPGQTASASGDSGVGADYFLGAARSERYYVALRARAQLLETFIEPASRLPTTINHCDLRPQNAAERADGSCILYDWDDAVAGPAGLSLHAQFGGCATPAALLEGGDALSGVEDARRKGELFETYIAELVNGGYASEKLLRQGLAGAICAGVLYYLLGYKSYPHESRSYKKTIGRIFEKRLSDLLDLCDMVSLRSGDLALEHALDYQQNGRPWRAESILRRLLWNPQHQNDAKAYAQLARVLHQRGKRSEATSFYREALQLGPQDPELHTDLGLALLERLRFDEAVARFRKAVHLDAAHKAAARSLDRACELRRAYEAAGRGGVVPTLRITDAESEAKEIRAETLALGHKLFEEYGVLLIENAYDPALAHACKEVFLEKYAAYLHDQRHDDALSLGDKRFQVTIEIAGVFSDPGIYGNPLIMSLMSKLLGKKFILGSVTSSISLPGSEEQRLHKDHPALFPTSKGYVPTPTFAVTTMVPLVALDETIGTTRVKKGSHLLTTRAAGSLPYQVPICPLGSCFLMDFRLSHRGQANRSHLSRPILNMVYQRPWFRDAVNFAKQPPLHVRPSEYERIPDELKRLFAWAMEPGPDVR